MSDRLERRYRRLLRAYPADYRAERGDELVGTYLDTVAPGRSRPGVRDAADVLAGAFRQRLRARGASGLPGGVSIAAVLALATGSILATCWLVTIELAPHTFNYTPGRPFGPFHTSAAFAWLAWLAAAVAFAAGAGRWCRWLIGSALVLMVLAKPIGVVAARAVDAEPWFDLYEPSFVVLVPHAALSVLALAAPSRPGPVVRWMPLVVALLSVVPAVRKQDAAYWEYAVFGSRLLLGVAAPLLLLATVLVVIYLLARRDARALWVPFAVLPPLALMSVDLTIYFGLVLSDYPGGRDSTPMWLWRSTVSVVSATVTVGAFCLAVALSGRPSARTTRGSGHGLQPVPGENA
ncbi:hypothetical protein [Cryptosporangium minutisporangium]|uniref:DUF1700 domain-containing protein n=1 Tax=Cryptosporangium minutisporangium TaxID=113569 RepID=A0ABP6SYI2_9ACTN